MAHSGNVAVVGATGNLGREVLSVLAHRGLEAEKVHAFASERTAGEEVEFGEETLEVESADEASFRSMSAVILATPDDASRKLAPVAQAAGAWVIDLSAAFRGDSKVPVGPALRRPAAGAQGRIVRVCSAVTSGLASVLTPLGALNLQTVQAWVLVPASEAGSRGINELQAQSAALLSGRPVEPEVFPHRLAFNVVPQVGSYDEGPSTDVERAWLGDLKALNPDLNIAGVTLTASRAPLFFGYVMQVQIELGAAGSVEKLREVFKKAGGLKILDDPKERIYPMPMLVAHDADIHLGRIQPVAGHSNRFTFMVTFDHASHVANQAVVLMDQLLGQQ